MPKRYILALIVIALIFFGGIALIISLVTGGGDEATPEVTTTQPAPVEREFVKDVQSITYTTYGPVVSEENRRAIRITVTAKERRAEVLSGYNETVIKSQVNPNNQAAFETLLVALAGAGYETTKESTAKDERSVCPNGRRYVYQANYSSGDPFRSWSVSCSSSFGNFAGSQSTIQRLLRNQVPEYTKFATGVKL